MLGNALFGSLACFACWPQLNLHAYTITRGVGHPQSHQSFFCPTVIIYLAARQRLCLHHTCDPAKATSKAHSRGNTFSVCLVTSIDKRGFAVGPTDFVCFFNHHEYKIAPNGRFVKEQSEVFFLFLGSFCLTFLLWRAGRRGDFVKPFFWRRIFIILLFSIYSFPVSYLSWLMVGWLYTIL